MGLFYCKEHDMEYTVYCWRCHAERMYKTTNAPIKWSGGDGDRDPDDRSNYGDD